MEGNVMMRQTRHVISPATNSNQFNRDIKGLGNQYRSKAFFCYFQQRNPDPESKSARSIPRNINTLRVHPAPKIDSEPGTSFTTRRKILTGVSFLVSSFSHDAEAQEKPVIRKTILVTGGSRGIGAATCLLLAEKGYDIAVNFNQNAEAAEDVVNKIRNMGGYAQAFQADVSKEEQILRMFQAIDETMPGGLHGLVNNAAIVGVSYIGTPMVYAMSKGAINSMEAGLVQPLIEQGIRVNNVSPGLTKTDILLNVAPAKIKSMEAATPLGRAGQPREIAQVQRVFPKR
ncbi:hypothetical protein CYMTET_19872 [Cymbomonas tetramitiformis]|uniref:Uncharacterized protein n=1 Tax=Cymbomonas tetramitiformis TaxID=36881 RepID=A0AAE0G5N3_9CHLO|nr:hypothetical protein CYMTET_19872 [Cymbomonas tetramitiformis]